MCEKHVFLKRILMVILGFAIICQSPVFVSANNHKAKTVKVGYYENEIFQEGASEDAVKSGYAYEYYRKLSEYTGWSYDYVYGSYNDLYQKLVDGEIDLLAGLAYREERKDFVSYPELPMGGESYVLVKHDSDKTITPDLSTISGHTIGVTNNALLDTLEVYLDNHGVNAKIIVFDEIDNLFSAFDSEEIDLLAAEGNGTNIRSHAEVLLAFGSAEYFICVNKNDSILLGELNDAQTQLFNEEPNYISTLNAKYFASSLSSRALSSIERDWLNTHESIKIGYLNNYLPYSDTAMSGQVTGIVKDVVPKIFELLRIENLQLCYEGFDNYDDMIAAINDGTIDAAFPVSGGLYYSEESGIYQTNSVLSSSTDLVYKNVVIYPDKSTFAINKNNKMQYYYVEAHYPNAETVFYDSIEACLNAVLDGEVDCTTLNGVRGSTILKNAEYQDLSLRQLSNVDDRCIGVKIGNEGLLRLLNRGIHILGSEYAENQAYRYVSSLYSETKTTSFKDYIPLILFILLALTFVVIVFLIVRIERLVQLADRISNENKSRAAFISNLSSIIREPIKEIATDSDNVKGGQLLSTIDNIIDLGLFEEGKVFLKEDKINIIAFVKDLEEMVRDNSSGKTVDLVFNVKGVNNKDIITDEEKLQKILMNILSNAVKYSKKGGSVEFLVEEVKCSNPRITNMIFTIKDCGIGMSPEFQKKAFEAYAREDSSINGAQGAGLGLTIAKNIVDLMGGEINLNSTKDAGSEFMVKVPVKINYGI